MVKEFVCDTEEYARVQGLDDAEIIAEASDNEAFLVRALANRYDVVCEKLTALEARLAEAETHRDKNRETAISSQQWVNQLEARCVQLEDNLRIAVKVGLDDQARIAQLEDLLRRCTCNGLWDDKSTAGSVGRSRGTVSQRSNWPSVHHISAEAQPMVKGVHKLTATARHVGMDVPDEVAFPLIMERLMKRRRLTAAGCWEYTGYVMPNGYCEISFRSHSERVHRLVYRIVKGPIPEGKVICHTCDNTICFNPDHLEPGTHQENTRQSVERQRHHETVKTHCPQGHAFAEHGVVYNGRKRRFCKACGVIRNRIRAGWPEHEANWTPDGRRNCRACHHAAVRRWRPKPPKKLTQNDRGADDA
jgi:hypothetical protein